jgi:hypothetical protein
VYAWQEIIGADASIMARSVENAGSTGLSYDLDVKDIEQDFFERNGYKCVSSLPVRA